MASFRVGTAIALTTVCLAACSQPSSEENPGGGSAPATTSAVSTPVTSAPAPTPTVDPVLSTAAYQAQLTAMDRRLRPHMHRLITAQSKETLESAAATLGEAMQAEATGLSRLRPPVAATAATLQFRRKLAERGGYLGDDQPDAAPKCGGAQIVMRRLLRRITADLAGPVKALAAQRLRAGTFVPAVGPERAERPSSGAVVVRSGSRGLGELRIDNGTSQDVAVSVVTGSPSSPQLMVYVRARGKASVSGINGSYRVYFKTGNRWSSSRRAFTSDCAYSRFEQSFRSRAIWQIGLQPTMFGNARTSDADPY